MQSDFLWQLFKDTGDPLCWLLFRHDEPRE